MLKRLSIFILVFALSLSLFAQPANETTESEFTQISVAALRGPTAMGLVQLMDRASEGPVNGNEYTFSIVGSPTEITPLLVRGEVDIAALPANVASVIYNNTDGAVSVLAVNTLGVLYIVENGNTVQSLQDLAGKTIYASGRGSTPEYALNYVLAQSGLENQVEVEWLSEHAECVSALMNDDKGVAMLPQPFVTTATMQNPNIRVALDLNDAWDEVSPDSALITGVIVARNAFIEENREAVDTFLEDYKISTDYTSTNLEDAARLVGEAGIVTEQVALAALPECNIVCITGDQLQNDLSKYLQVLFDANPTSVGGALPGEDFYY